MKKIITLIVGALICTAGFAQEKPEAVLMKASVAPTLDGVIDEVWAEANTYNVNLPYQTEAPTLGADGETTWKGLWTDDGIYVLVTVTDDEWYPHYTAGMGNPWEFDKVEIYFDVNYDLNDGIGGGAANSGHYQFAPDPSADNIAGELIEESNYSYAQVISAPNRVMEYFVPFTSLLDKDNVGLDQTAQFGFDVTVIDRETGDDARKRAVWANIGGINESYSNMDDCGLVTLDGAAAPTYIETITLAGETTITTDNGTVQITATILPEDASNQNLKWTVTNTTGKAKVVKGLVTAIKDGDVTVTAAATDGSYIETTWDVTISGQTLQIDEANLIQNGNFDVDTENWGGWIDGGYGEAAVLEDGAVKMVVLQIHETEAWHYQFNQEGFKADTDVPYVLKFKAWSTADRTMSVDFEDIGDNGNNRYGESSDPTAVGGESEWLVPLTATPTWFEFNVTFPADQILDNTIEKLQFMVSNAIEPVYLDSVLVARVSDLLLVNIRTPKADNVLNVYPNPVGAGGILNIELKTLNNKIEIYNILGRKVKEKISNSKVVTFDVSDLQYGVYFVKLGDGSSFKFLR